MADLDASDKLWIPPTPQSILVPLKGPSPPPLVGFEPLPPPLSAVPQAVPSPGHWERRDAPRGLAGLLNNADVAVAVVPRGRATPSSVTLEDNEHRLAPMRGYFSEAQPQAEVDSDEDDAPVSTLPSNGKARLSSEAVASGVTTLDDYEDAAPSRRKRPRREASVAAKLALRQPSPLDLSPPFRPTGGAGGNGGGGGSQANRKVSHSLIERRRREKINQCLATLSEVVPQNQEERERKDKKAKERGRKRGRKGDDGDDDGNRNGLHKLEVLEGTILYIRQLEERVAELEAASPPPRSSPVQQLRSPTASSTDLSTLDSGSYEQAPTTVSTSLPTGPPTTSLAPRQWPVDVAEDPDTAAGLLLLSISTSPELRPVFFD